MEIAGKFSVKCHGAKDVRDARLDCGMGMGNPRGRRRVVASVDEGAATAHKRLVRAVFRPCCLSANSMAFEKICGHRDLKLGSDCGRYPLFHRWENCFKSRNLISDLAISAKSR
jgi:hypothetical protein